MQFWHAVSRLALLGAIGSAPADAAPLAERSVCTGTNDTDCVPGFSDKHYYANFEAILNGTNISKLQGLDWSGWQSTTLRQGIIPADCYYFGPDRSTKCHYGFAGHARDANISNLPSLAASAPASLFKLTNFSFALGGMEYYGPDETLQIQGCNPAIGYGARKMLSCGSTPAVFNYSTAIAGAVGAPVIQVSMPADFGLWHTYVFNVTTPGDAEPVVYIDDVNIVTYTALGLQ